MTREKALALRALIEKAAVSLSDEDALGGVELFPAWEADTSYERGIRRRYDGRLFRCEQAHTSQIGWEPPNVPALWTEVAKPGQGDTPDNPIPYNGNMELLENKYYSEDGVTYRCFRGTGIPVYNRLDDLVGIYVEVVVS